jgi:hypothetical protein
MELDITKNTGFIEGARNTDWIVGGESGAIKPVLELTGQWDQYLPDPDVQAKLNGTPNFQFYFETQACVSFSALQNVETLLNHLRKTGQMPSAHETFLQQNGYIDPVTNSVFTSKRFTAKMSGTTPQGNYMYAVGDSIRKLHGVLPATDWQWPNMDDLINATPQERWARYYADVPQDLQNKALKFLDYFQINYEWVNQGLCNQTNLEIKDALQYGPVQIASMTCTPWNMDGMSAVPACSCGANHATMIYGYDDVGWKDFDHYVPFNKKLASDYYLPWVLQYSVIPIGISPFLPTFHHTFDTQLTYGMPAGPEVAALQEALQTLKRKDGNPYMKVGIFGPFGPLTKQAVSLFQLDNGIVDPNPGQDVGPQTRSKLNQLLNT